MRIQTQVCKAVVGLFCMAAALAAHAASSVSTATYTLPTPFWIDDRVVDEGGVAREAFYTLSHPQFDTALGVLTAAPVTLSNRGLLTGETTSASNAGEAWVYMEARMLGSYAPVAYSFLSVSGVQQRIALVGASETLPVVGSLTQFVGTGTVESQVYLVLVAKKTAGGSGPFSSSMVARLDTRPFVSTQTINYTYLEHANASFASGSDVNALSLDVGPEASSFEVFALPGSLGAAETTMLDAVSLSCVSGCGDFTVSLPSVQDVPADGSGWASASLLAQAPGTYSAQYLLTFSDDTAIGVGQQQNTLTLNLTGTVAAVPEPGAWALLLAGLGSVILVARRRFGLRGRPLRSRDAPD